VELLSTTTNVTCHSVGDWNSGSEKGGGQKKLTKTKERPMEFKSNYMLGMNGVSRDPMKMWASSGCLCGSSAGDGFWFNYFQTGSKDTLAGQSNRYGYYERNWWYIRTASTTATPMAKPVSVGGCFGWLLFTHIISNVNETAAHTTTTASMTFQNSRKYDPVWRINPESITCDE